MPVDVNMSNQTKQMLPITTSRCFMSVPYYLKASLQAVLAAGRNLHNIGGDITGFDTKKMFVVIFLQIGHCC